PLDRRHWLRPGRPEPSPDRPLAAARGTRLRHSTVTLDRAIRPGLPTVARALIGYGIVGVIVAMVALVVLFVGLARLNGLSDRVRDLGGVPTVLERTATVLDSASSSARGFGTTIDSSTAALTTAAADLRQIVPQLHDIESQA